MLIYKENHELEVSPDAYKSMYKRLGYQVKGTVKKLDVQPKGNEKDKKSETNENTKK